ncbi:hypothetical protein D3C71_1547650 [compost metagenome]
MAFIKWLLLMPRRAAVSFIMSAKASSLPAMYSARAILASLPDWMITPCSRSSTLAWLFSGRNMVEPPEAAPPVRQACSLMGTRSCSPILPLRISSVAM